MNTGGCRRTLGPWKGAVPTKSVLTTLGGGSGIDTAQLVSDVVAAQRAGADALLQSRQEKVDARISTLSQIKSALSSFSTALNALVSSGSLGRQTVSSDSATVAASASVTGEQIGRAHL